jgi:hypothetical protein
MVSCTVAGSVFMVATRFGTAGTRILSVRGPSAVIAINSASSAMGEAGARCGA